MRKYFYRLKRSGQLMLAGNSPPYFDLPHYNICQVSNQSLKCASFCRSVTSNVSQLTLAILEIIEILKILITVGIFLQLLSTNSPEENRFEMCANCTSCTLTCHSRMLIFHHPPPPLPSLRGWAVRVGVNRFLLSKISMCSTRQGRPSRWPTPPLACYTVPARTVSVHSVHLRQRYCEDLTEPHTVTHSNTTERGNKHETLWSS